MDFRQTQRIVTLSRRLLAEQSSQQFLAHFADGFAELLDTLGQEYPRFHDGLVNGLVDLLEDDG